jgi:protein-disulfide isomerase
VKRLLIAVLASLAAVAAPGAAAPGQAQAQRDWTQTVVATPEGGFRMGNPDAPLRIVEFVSLSCPHCRHFAQEGAPALVRDHVRSGHASFEIRAYPLDILASTAAQLNRCLAPAHAFAFNDEILATQEQWFGRVEAMTPEQINELESASGAEQRRRIAAALGWSDAAARHGLGPAQARACLDDEAGFDRLEAIKEAATAMGVQGTPSFLLNGRLLPDVYDWAGLQPLLAR